MLGSKGSSSKEENACKKEWKKREDNPTKANPNPTGAVSVSDVIKDKPIINVSGCPPIPVVITGVLTQYLTFGKLPELDALGRPRSFYGQTIHDRCYRRPFYERGQFADSFDDDPGSIRRAVTLAVINSPTATFAEIASGFLAPHVIVPSTVAVTVTRPRKRRP